MVDGQGVDPDPGAPVPHPREPDLLVPSATERALDVAVHRILTVRSGPEWQARVRTAQLTGRATGA